MGSKIPSPSAETPGVNFKSSPSFTAGASPASDLVISEYSTGPIGMAEMELLHHYSTSTCYTISRLPVLQTVWRITVPRLGFASPFLLHGILALSALHLAYLKPDHHANYAAQAEFHHNLALQTVSPILPRIDEDNATAVYLFSTITSIISCAKPRLPDDFWVIGDRDIEWMSLFRGTRFIIATAERTIKSGAISPILANGKRRSSARNARSTSGLSYLDDLRDLLRNHVTQADELECYFNAIEDLSKSFATVEEEGPQNCQTADVFVWLLQISDDGAPPDWKWQRAPGRPERNAKPVFAPASPQFSHFCHTQPSLTTLKIPMMELNTAESTTEDIDSEPCHSHDSQDAKVERRRQQNRRNAQAWKLMKIYQKPRDASGEALRQCYLSHPHLYHHLIAFESAAYRSYCSDPRADHRLTLVKLNVFRAFVRNITALGYTREWMTDESLWRFSVHGPHAAHQDERVIPASLQPTELQQKQPHHPWLDFFPFGRLRDNLIRHEDTMDDSQFCRDLMGFWNMPDDDNFKSQTQEQHFTTSPSTMASQLWLITGASSGFGALMAEHALRAGHRVLATARNPQKAAQDYPQVGDLGGK
ncbi:uncharacterized protein MYU51_012739 [Penicillium brevicompactum]